MTMMRAGWMFDPDHSRGRLPMRPPAPQRHLPTMDEVRAATARTADQVANATTAGLPPLTAAGELPPGIHVTTRSELAREFGATPERAARLADLDTALRTLRMAGVEHAVVGGSLLSSKAAPDDVDLAWLPNGRTHPKVVDFALTALRDRAPRVSVHRADRIVENALELAGATRGETFVELLAHTRTGAARGVALLATTEVVGGPTRESIVRHAARGLQALARA